MSTIQARLFNSRKACDCDPRFFTALYNLYMYLWPMARLGIIRICLSLEVGRIDLLHVHNGEGKYRSVMFAI